MTDANDGVRLEFRVLCMRSCDIDNSSLSPTPAYRRGSETRRGFTLIELMLVLAVIALAAAVVVPSLRGWGQSSRMRDGVDEFVSATHYARTQAISSSKMYRITVDPRGGDRGMGQFQVMVLDGQSFAPDTGEFGNPVQAPDGCRVELMDLGGKSLDSIDFFPNGRSQPARFRVTDLATNVQKDVECQTASEMFRVVVPNP